MALDRPQRAVLAAHVEAIVSTAERTAAVEWYASPGARRVWIGREPRRPPIGICAAGGDGDGSDGDSEVNATDLPIVDLPNPCQSLTARARGVASPIAKSQ